MVGTDTTSGPPLPQAHHAGGGVDVDDARGDREVALGIETLEQAQLTPMDPIRQLLGRRFARRVVLEVEPGADAFDALLELLLILARRRGVGIRAPVPLEQL